MENEIVQERDSKDSYLWSVVQISLAAYLAGPVGGCYFMGRNYKEAGNPVYSRRCYMFGIVSAFALLTLLIFLPDHMIESIPRTIIPITYAAFITSFAHVYQKNDIREKLKAGSKRYSYLWCFLIVLSLIIIQVPLVFLYSMLLSLI